MANKSASQNEDQEEQAEDENQDDGDALPSQKEAQEGTEQADEWEPDDTIDDLDEEETAKLRATASKIKKLMDQMSFQGKIWLRRKMRLVPDV